LANSAQAKKRARQSENARLHNASQRSEMRTSIKKVIKAIEGGNKDQAQTAYNNAVPLIDAMVTKGIIHKNKAARHKSRLNKHIRSI